MTRNIFSLSLLVFTFFSAQSQNESFNSIKSDFNTIEKSKNKEVNVTVLKYQNTLNNSTETNTTKEFVSVKQDSFQTTTNNSKIRRNISVTIIPQKEISKKRIYKTSSLTNEREKSKPTNSKSHTLIAIPIKNQQVAVLSII